jgi:hypothetical protein
MFTHFISSGGALQVSKSGLQRCYKIANRFYLVTKVGPEKFADKFVKLVCVPPAVHVGFTQPQGTGSYYPGIEVVVMDMDIPWALTVDLNISIGKELFNPVMEFFLWFTESD